MSTGYTKTYVEIGVKDLYIFFILSSLGDVGLKLQVGNGHALKDLKLSIKHYMTGTHA